MKRLKPSAKAAELAPNQPLRVNAMAFAVAVALSSPAALFAQNLPTGLQTTNGSVTVTNPTATSMGLIQSTQNAGMKAQTFSIGSGHRVDVHQPNSSSIMVMNVIGTNPSSIFGTLTANGRFFLVNPLGILFAPGATVDVGGLVATTMPISFADATSGRYVFTNNGNSGSVVNQGRITALNGYVGLFAPKVINEGIIVARMGQVALAAGNQVTLDMVGDGLIKVTVNEAALNASVMNKGTIEADGGNVLLTAKSANALLDTVINTDGIIRANTIANRNGTIVLDGGDKGIVSVAGTIEANGNDAGTIGGTVKALGQYVGVGLDGSTANINASGDAGGGTVLIGGNFQGQGPEKNAHQTFVGNASISADAITSGNGGKVILWSNDTTQFYGNISARGGAQGGDGGIAEVSGKVNLGYHGHVNLSAPLGRSGSLLLDPAIINIVEAGGTHNAELPGIAFGEFADATISVDRTAINTTAGNIDLNAGEINFTNTGNLIRPNANESFTFNVDTGQSGTAGGNGNITVNNGGTTFQITTTGSGTITFTANNAINLSNGASGVAQLNTATGAVSVTAGTAATTDAITTAGGAVTVTATAGALTSNGAITTTPAALSGGTGGNVVLKGGTTVTLNGAVTATGATGATGTAAADPTPAGAGGTGGAGGQVFVYSTGAGTITQGAAITAAGGTGGVGGAGDTLVSGNGGTGGAGGVVTLRNDNGAIALHNVSTVGGAGGAAGAPGTGGSGTPGSAGTAGSIQLQSTGGDITQTGGTGLTAQNLKVVSSGSVTLNQAANAIANVAATLSTAASSFSYTNSGALSVATVANGLSTLDSGNANIQSVDGVSTTNGAISLIATTGGLTVTDTGAAQDVNAGTSTVTLEARGVDQLLTVAGNVQGTGSVSLYVADHMALTGTTTATDMRLRPFSSGVAIELGLHAGETAGKLKLSAAELNTVSASNGMAIGSFGSTGITVNAAIAPSGVSKLALLTDGTLTQTGGSTITVGQLLVDAATVNLNEANSVSTLAGEAFGAGGGPFGPFTFRNAGALTIGSVSVAGGSFDGILTQDQPLTLIANTGGLTVSNTAAAQDVNAGTSTVSLTAGGASQLLTVSGAVQGTGGVTYVADNMTLTGAITAGAGAVNIDSATASQAITLGTGGSGLGLSAAELNTITGSGTLTIGSATHTGTISTDGALDLTTSGTFTGPTRLHTSGGAITLNNAVTTPGNLTLDTKQGGGTGAGVTGTGALTVGAAGASGLTVISDNGISLSNAGNLANAVVLTNTGAGSILFNNNRAMTLQASDTVSGGTITVVNATGTLATAGTGVVSGAGASNISLQTAGLLTVTNGSPVTAGGTGAVSLTGGGVTVSDTVTGPGGITVVAGAGTFTNTAATGSLTNSAGATAISVTANDWALGAGSTIAGGSGDVTIARTGNAQINLGTALTTAEIATITTTGTLFVGASGNTGNIDVAGAVSFAGGPAKATLRADGVAGTITDSSGAALTVPTNTLTLSAHSGIGVIAGAPIVLSGTPTNLSATNSTAGDLFLQTDSITLGGGGNSISERDGGTLRIDATNAAANSIVIAGNVTAGATGTVTLNTGTAGTITEQSAGAGTVTGATVNLGTGSTPASIGTLAAPILTATSNLDARSGAGAIFVSNTGALANTNVVATGGLVNLQNTGALTTGTGNITSSNNTVTVNAGGLVTNTAARTIGLAGGTGTSVTGAGVTNSGTIIAGGGAVSVNAGTGTLTNTVTTGTISNNASANAINLTADDMVLAGAITAGAGAVNIDSATASQAITLGTGGSGLGLSAAELNTITGSGTLTIGSATHTGTISTDGALDLTTSGTFTGPTRLHTSGGAITLNNAVTTPGNLTLDTKQGGGTGAGVTGTGALTVGAAGASGLTVISDNGISLSNAGNLANAVVLTNTGAGSILFNNNRAMTLQASDTVSGGTITVVNATGTLATAGTGVVSGAGASNISLQTAGLLTVTNGSPVTAGGTGAVSLTGGGVTVSDTVTGPGGITVVAGAGTFTNTAATGSLTNSAGATAISVTANDWALGAGSTIAGGSGDVTIARTGNAQINLGTALTTAEIATITTTGTLFVGASGNTGNIDVAGAVSFAGGPAKATLRADGVAGTITDSSGAALTVPTNTLTLSAHSGIGVIAGAPIVLSGTPTNLSATNSTAGDLYLKTGTITLGGAGVVLSEQAAGTLRIDATNAAADSIDIAGAVSVGTAGGVGTIELNTGTTGTITRSGAGTAILTAGTVNLGTGSTPASIGTLAAPILTATSNLDARSGAGAIFVSNTGALANTNVVATGGLVNLQNTGALTTGTGNITSSNNTVTVNAGGLVTNTAARTIGLAGGTGTSVTGAGVTNSGTIIAGGGAVSVNAGTGTLTNTVTTGTISNNASANAINLTADDMVLAGAITAGAGAVNIDSATASQAITLGTGGSGLGLSAAELNTITGSGTLTIGSATHTGTISTDGALDLTTSGTFTGPTRLHTSGGAITLNNAVTTPGNLTLDTKQGGGTGAGVTGTGALTVGAAGASGLTVISDNGISLSNAGNLANAVVLTNTGAGSILFNNNRAMTLQASDTVSGGTITVVNATGTLATAGTGVVSGAGASNISLQTAGLLTVTNGSPVTAGGTGAVSLTGGGVTVSDTVTGPGGITVVAGAGTFTNTAATGSLTNSAGATAISVTANDWALGAGSTIAGGSGDVTIARTGNAQINLGTALTTAEIATITTTGTLFVGASGNTGNIDVAGAVSFAGGPAKATLRADGVAGTITDSSGAALTVPTNTLTLSAHSGIGVIAGAPIVLSGTPTNLSATNSTAGDLYLKTGTITLGGAGVVLSEQAAGTLRIDATNAAADSIDIAGAVSVGTAGGVGTIELNTGTTGTITRSGAGTAILTAGTVNLGTGSTPASIGTLAAPILTATSNLDARSGAGAIFVSNTGALANTNVVATGGLVNLQNTGALTTGTGNITSSNNTVTVNAGGLVTNTAARTIGLAGGTGTSVTGAGVTNSGTINGGSGDILIDGNTGAISLAGPVTTTSNTANAVIVRDASSIALGNVTTGTAGGTTTIGVSNDVTGPVTQTGIITTDILAGSTTSTVNLPNANLINEVGAFNANGLTVNDNAGGLDVTGVVNAGTGLASLTTTGGTLAVTGTGSVAGTGVTLTSGGSDISLAGAVNGNADPVTLNSTGNVTQTAAGTISTGGTLFLVGAGGTFNLATANNAVASLDADNAQVATLSFRDNSGFAVAGINSAGAVTLDSAGAVTTGGGAITGTTLTLQDSTAGGAATFTLTNAANAVATLDANNNTLASLSFRDTGALAVDGILASGAVTLDSPGAVTQTAPIQATTLTLQDTTAGAAATFTLNDAANAVTTLKANNNTLASVIYRDANNLVVDGITASGAVTLDSPGAVTQTAPITGSTLTLQDTTGGGAATFNLGTQNNAVSILDANNNPLTTLSFRNDASFEVAGANTSGAGNTTLSSTGTVTQSALISAVGLQLLGAGGTFNLNTQINSISLLAGNTGSVLFRGDAGFAVGTVNAMAGLTATTAATLTSLGGTVSQTAAGVITTPSLTLTGAGGTFNLATASNAVTTLDADNVQIASLSFKDDSGFTVAGINSAGPVVLESAGGIVGQGPGSIVATTLTLQGAGGTYNLDTQNNDVNSLTATTSAAVVNFRDDNGFDVTGLNPTTSATLSSTGPVTQSGLITTPTLTLTTNSAGTGTFSFGAMANNVTTLGTGTQVDTVAFQDNTGGFGIAAGGLSAATAVTLSSTNTVTQAGAITTPTLTLQGAGGTYNLGTQNNDVNSLTATTSAAVVNFRDDDGFDVTGLNPTTSATLSSTGAVSQSGAITTTGLELVGGGAYTLNTTPNTVTTIAGSTGNLLFDNTGGLDVGTVTTVGLTVGGNLTLTTGGAVTQSAPLVVIGTSNINANAGAAAITLNGAGNNFGGTATMTGTIVQLADTGGMTVVLNDGGASTLQAAGPLVTSGTTTGLLTTTTTAGGTTSFGTTNAGSMNVTSAGGVSQSGPITTAAATISAAGQTVALTNGTNNFTGVVDITAGATSITDGAGGLTLGTLNTGDLTVNSSGGGLNLGQGTVGGALVANSNNQAITQAAALTVTGTSSITAGTAPITLTAAANNFVGPVTLSNSGAANAVQITDANIISFAPSTLGGDFTVNSSGLITLTGVTNTGVQQYNNAVSLTGTFNTNGNNFNAIATTGIAGTTTVSVGAGVATFTGAVEGPGGLTVNSSAVNGETFMSTIGAGTALASISTDAPGSVSLGGNVTTVGDQTFLDAITASGITLNAGAGTISASNPANNITGVLGLTGGVVGVVNSGPLTLGALNTGALTVTSNGALDLGSGSAASINATSTNAPITQSGALTVGDATINAGSSTINLGTPTNNFTGTVNLTGTGGATIVDADALTLGTLNTGALTVTSTGPLNLGQGTVTGALTAASNGGAITQSAALTITGTSNIAAGAGLINLSNAGNNFVGGVTASSSSAGGISFADANDFTPTSITTTSTSGTGTITLLANHILAGSLVGSGNAVLTSQVGVTGLDMQFPNAADSSGNRIVVNPPPAAGNSGPWTLTGSTNLNQSQLWDFQPPELVITMNLVPVAFINQSALGAAAAAQANAATAASDAGDVFGTDSVAQQIEYGFAGDVGTLPPIDHRLQGVGISVPKCFNESREGESCAGQER